MEKDRFPWPETDDADKVCACGCDKIQIGDERSEKLDIIPAKAQVIVHIRPKYVCKNCEGVQDVGAKTFLGDFRGYVQTDGYVGYDFLDRIEGMDHIGCWAHARRKFTDVLKSLGKNSKNSSANKALRYIKKMYKLEKEARKGRWSRDEIYRMRQDKAEPILNEFKKWLSREILLTPPKGLLGKAIAYTLNQWNRLAGYIKDGCLTMDNNMAENSIRPFVIGRKNWLFSGTPRGAEASALLYSLIETAKANKLEPYAYLRHIFGKLPLASCLEDYEALLPWNVTRDHMEQSRLTECA